ncbi:MAG: hypothetical protein K6C32_02505 [Bacilli bacterium]|nr:hypothetical protein [Bacilli bacterium]
MAKDIKTLTKEEQQRKAVLSRRMFWILVIFDILLVIYLIVQIALLMK